ncbi:MAG: phenylacetate--CoA ligase [Oscillospiraceae bacterium]
MFFQKEIETMPREEIRALQLTRLRESAARAYTVPLYKKKFDELGIKPDDIKSLDDLRNLPFTYKADFRDNYPFNMYACPMRDIVRIHASSGTTGKPTVVGYTKNDIELWSDIVARLAMSAGASADDVAQIAFGYGLFTGAFGLHYGLEKIGAAVIPMSSGNTEKQLMLMQDFGSTVLVATPTYALYLSETAKEMGIVDKLKLRIGLFGGEGCTPGMRRQIEENFNIKATDNYGMSELIGPGVSGECSLRCGLHVAEDHFIPEIIDPDTGEVLPEGAVGELVMTSLTKEALPVMRYRTGDISSLNYEKCECGRTHVRMAKVTGRSDDMLIIKGVNVFPSQIEGVLISIHNIGPHYQLEVRRENFSDTLTVVVELINGELLERYTELENLRSEIKHKLRTVLGIDAKINLVSPKTIVRSEGKSKVVVDLRDKI